MYSRSLRPQMRADARTRWREICCAESTVESAHVENRPLMQTTSLLPSAPAGRARRCPHCRGMAVTRSRRQGIWGLFILRWTRIHLYRCVDCWKRFHGLGRLS
jgi:DNA-directed RNA polymerase subunit RPC12/RpoP